jgi:hypothetical protein
MVNTLRLSFALIYIYMQLFYDIQKVMVALILVEIVIMPTIASK